MKKSLSILFVSLVAMFSSCTEVMEDFDLTTAEPKIVVDASVSPQKAQVILSKTTSYLNPNNVPYISGASIYLSFNDTQLALNEDSAGYYSATMNFPEETTYELNVMIGKENIRATSYMPKVTLWDSVMVQKSEFADWIPAGLMDSTKTLYDVLGYMTDIKSVVNYYKVDIWHADTLLSRSVTDDGYFDGQAIQLVTLMGAYSSTDTLRLYLSSIDKAAYEFYNTLALSNSSSGMFSAPDNPKSNLEGDALGRFYAYSVDSLYVTFPEKE